MARYWESRTTEPISQFVPLPLDQIAAYTRERQQIRDNTRAALDEADVLLGAQTIEGVDAERAAELQRHYNTAVEGLTDEFMNATDDNSYLIQNKLGRLQREVNTLKNDPNSEIGKMRENKIRYEQDLERLLQMNYDPIITQAAQKHLLDKYNLSGGLSYNDGKYNSYRNISMPDKVNMSALALTYAKEIIPKTQGWEGVGEIQVKKNDLGELVFFDTNGSKSVTLTEADVIDQVTKAMAQDKTVSDYYSFLSTIDNSAYGDGYKEQEIYNAVSSIAGMVDRNDVETSQRRTAVTFQAYDRGNNRGGRDEEIEGTGTNARRTSLPGKELPSQTSTYLANIFDNNNPNGVVDASTEIERLYKNNGAGVNVSRYADIYDAVAPMLKNMEAFGYEINSQTVGALLYDLKNDILSVDRGYYPTNPAWKWVDQSEVVTQLNNGKFTIYDSEGNARDSQDLLDEDSANFEYDQKTYGSTSQFYASLVEEQLKTGRADIVLNDKYVGDNNVRLSVPITDKNGNIYTILVEPSTNMDTQATELNKMYNFKASGEPFEISDNKMYFNVPFSIGNSPTGGVLVVDLEEVAKTNSSDTYTMPIEHVKTVIKANYQANNLYSLFDQGNGKSPFIPITALNTFNNELQQYTNQNSIED